MSVEHGWCGGTEVGEQLRDELIDATIDWFYSASQQPHPSTRRKPCLSVCLSVASPVHQSD